MNKTKRTFLLLLAAIMAASAFTACGGEEKNTESTASAILEDNSAQTAEITNEETTEQSSESETEAATEAVTEAATEEDLYSYYELLNEEYEKYGETRWRKHGIAGNTMFYTDTNGNYYIYEIGSNEPATVVTTGSSMKPYTFQNYYNGSLYMKHDSMFYRMDLDGNIVQEVSLEFAEGYLADAYVTGDNEAILCIDDVNIPYNEWYILSPDWSEYTPIPNPQKEAAHGLMEDVYISCIIGEYNRNLYVLGEDAEIFSINMDTFEYKQLDSETIKSYADFGELNYANTQMIGKYLLAGNVVYDVETDEIIAVSKNIGRNYYGGLYNIYDTEIVKEANGGETSEPVYESVWIGYPLNEEYHAYVDEYGIFLRKYGEDDTSEEVVYLFED